MRRKGFTLIELVMVIAILGILAAMVLPRFVNLQDQAKISATKGALGAIRAAVAIKYASNVAADSSSTYPTTLTTDLFADGKIPENKCMATTGVTATVAAAAAGVNTTAAWLYYSDSGNVWAGGNNASASTW